MPIKSILVELERNAYPILMGDNLLKNSRQWRSYIASDQVMIVTNERVAELYLPILLDQLSDFQCDYMIIPDGEQFKSIETFNIIISELAAKKHRRNTTLIALGGGVIGDLTGFAAGCYMRGISYLQIPTTLLAQIDAAIGGKTAVNYGITKNLLGLFHQPKAVIIDINVLHTLPDREFKAGLAEAIKYGLIKDVNFFKWLVDNIDLILKKDLLVLNHLIATSAKIKADYVSQDEFDQDIKGLRVNLNYGHTFAHAIETGLGYGEWLHGEAVGLGMLLAAAVSEKKKLIKREEVDQIKKILKKIGLPVQIPKALTPKTMLELMLGDKKNRSNRIRLVLLKAIGESFATEDVDNIQIQETLVSYTSDA